MAHPRIGIRAALVSALTGLASGAVVRAGRALPEQIGDLPAYNVQLGAESVELQIAGAPAVPRVHHRTLDVVIECRQRGVQVEDALDALAEEVEAALGADKTLGGRVDWLAYAGTDAPERSAEFEEDVALLAINYVARYRGADVNT